MFCSKLVPVMGTLWLQVARFISIDNGAGCARIWHLVLTIQVLYVLRPESKVRYSTHQPDLRTSPVAASQWRDGLHRGRDAYVRRLTGRYLQLPTSSQSNLKLDAGNCKTDFILSTSSSLECHCFWDKIVIVYYRACS